MKVTLFRGPQAEDIPDHSAISDHVGHDGEVLWVDLVDETEDDLVCIQQEFNLHQLAVDDVRKKGQRPKIELYPSHAFIVGYAHDADPLDLPEVEMFVGPNWLISVRSRNEAGRAFDVDPVRARYLRTCADDPGVGFLLYTILDDMVDGYFGTVELAEDRLAAVESTLFAEYSDDETVTDEPGGGASRGAMTFDRHVQSELLHLRRVLIGLRRKVVPMREVVLVILRRELPGIHEETILYFQDVLDHLLRVVDEIDTQRELLGNIVDAHLALVANRTNDVMKKTSSWGAILIVATLIAGIYGMNFRNMPELEWHFGYFGVLGSMLVVTGLLYLYFKRKGWL